MTSHCVGDLQKTDAGKRRLRRQGTTIEYEIPATQQQPSPPSTPGSARRELFQDAQPRSDMSLIRSPVKPTSVFGDEDEQKNDDEEEQDENEEQEEPEDEEDENQDQDDEDESEEPAPLKRPAAKVARGKGAANPRTKSKVAKPRAKAKASPKKTRPAGKAKAAQLKEQQKAQTTPGSARDTAQPPPEIALPDDGRATLLMAETQEIEAERQKTAKFKAYKARKERFYRSLRSRILSYDATVTMWFGSKAVHHAILIFFQYVLIWSIHACIIYSYKMLT